MHQNMERGGMDGRKLRCPYKHATNGSAIGNYRAIACLNLLLKKLAGIIAEKSYSHLDEEHLLLKD